jgi:uncharacterized protein (TIGR02147 family)
MNEPHAYRSILRKELEDRCSRKSSYSLRAFARDIGISPASLSLVLAGRQGLSVQTALKIGKKLSLNAGELRVFRDSVESCHARNPARRRAAQLRMGRHVVAASTLQLDAFHVMSDWYHFAILELTEIEGFNGSPKWIAKALGIQESVAKLAIERLKRLELLEEHGGQGRRLRQTQGFLATPSGVPSGALKKFHSQVLKKAETALYTQSVEERDFSAVMMPVRLKDIEWAKEEIKPFRRSLMERLESSPKKERIYCLSIQFFDLQEKEK